MKHRPHLDYPVQGGQRSSSGKEGDDSILRFVTTPRDHARLARR